MSILVTRSPLEPIAMNADAAALRRRRSKRLSQEDSGSGNPDEREGGKGRKGRGVVNGSSSTTVGTKEGDGSGALGRSKRKVYEEEVDGFTFSKKRAKPTKESAVRPAPAGKTSPAKAMPPPPPPPPPPPQAPREQPRASPQKPDAKAIERKSRRKLPTTPERETSKPVRRSKRLSNEEPEQRTSPHKPAHAQSHANHERSPSPTLARPATVEKKRKTATESADDQKTMRIQLPFQDTPVIRRNKEMRKSTVNGGSRRSSSGMRGRRVSSLFDEGHGSALPHAEVSPTEYYKHISEDLTEPRRMRCLLGWCSTRALPSRPDPPKDQSAEANLEFQALQAARVIQEELSRDLIADGSLSEWWSRDDDPAPPLSLRKKPNPRNVANAAKAEELEKELERLKSERAEWDALLTSANTAPSPPKPTSDPVTEGQQSPLQLDLLDSPQRRLFEQLRAPPVSSESATEPSNLERRLRNVTENLEFAVDQFAHGVHALAITRETGERLADHTLEHAAEVLAERERVRRVDAKAVDPMAALRGLARVLNGKQSQSR